MVQHPSFRESINSIFTATNQEKTINIVNVETNQTSRIDSTKIPSAGSTSNGSSRFVRDQQLRFESQA